ncbi:fibronectin type III domain-containing protein [Hymenobacter sp. DH14]|uniref:Fibronectin type III domain-containing protein n=1 Tax=Hymenobacter cyanobacteriorum TaxID=2926463 RepID=A0A9X1VH66_9BACT|nr:fibronectin type III domain-containing protein [Hymenobacter cyanobacteriorum]MCI1188520.1 fibronectin type III domain-containing protein [Hymenobacter cyanobacteriorum]
MQQPLLSGNWARRLALASASVLGLALNSPTAHGQSLNYSSAGATNVAGTFSSIAGTGSFINVASSDDANSAATSIGFNFAFNGSSFTQFVLNTNGFIKLGSSAPSSPALFFTPEINLGADVFASTNAADVNIIAPFNCDLEAGLGGAGYYVQTSGSTGSRVCTIQWTNVRDKAMTNTVQYAQFSFQVKLYEGSNRVELVYGPCTANNTGTDAFRASGAGLKGSGASTGQEVLFIKGSAQTWDLASAIDSYYSSSTLNYRQTVRPDAGRTYRFEPTAPSSVANNECSAATLLTPGSTCVATNGTTVGATQSIGPATCSGAVGSSDDDVWYRFVATSPVHTVAVTGGTAFDAVLDIRSGSCPGVTIGCADATGNAGTETVNLTGLTVGATYYARVYSYGSASTDAGTFSICVTGGGTANDAGVSAIYTLGQLPQLLATPHTVQAVVVNNGTAILNNLNVTLTVAGANTFTNTQTVASLAVGASTTVTFAAYPLTNAGTNNMTVRVPADGNTTNDVQTYTQVVSASRLAYVDGAQALNPTSVGVGVAGGVLAAKYTLPQPSRVTSITPTFVNAGTAGTTYQVRLYDATGTGGTPGTILYTSATQTRPSATASPTIAVPDVTVGNSFYVAIVELDNNLSLGYQVEDPLRPATFYFQGTSGAFTLINTTPLKTRLALEASVVPVPCVVATNLATSNVTPTGATVSFTPAAGATGYTLTITPQGGTATTQTATASPVTLTNLTPGTTYTVSLVTTCAASQVSTPITTTFTTPFPPCVAVTNLTASNLAPNSATLTFTAASGATSYTVTYTPQGGTAQTQTATGSPVNLASLIPGTLYTATITTSCAGNQNSPAASTTFTTPFPPCPAISGLAASNLTPNGATLTFTSAAGATGYTVTYTPQGGTAQTQTATGSPVTLANLIPGTLYTASVVTNCASNQASAAVTTTFTTPFPPCPAATGLAVGNITTTGASVSFTPAAGATGYTVTYTAQGGTAQTQTATGSPVTLAGLTPGTLYTVAITTNCTAGQTSPAASITFTTGTPCVAVTNLAAGSITTTGATLTFTAPAAGATSFTVAYTPAGGTTLTQTATGSPVVLAGLQPGTSYTATVTTNCGGGQTSPLASTTFTTTTPSCVAATSLAVGSISATAASVSFTPAAGATSYALTLTPQGGTATTQTVTASPVSLTNLTPGTAYTVSLVTTCAAGQTSPAVVTTFSTPAPAPTNAAAGSITATGATISFTPAAGATSYTVTYTPQGGTAATITATGSPVVLTGLASSKAYSVTIVANYPGGGTSAPLTVAFTTLTPTATREALAGGTLAVYPNPAHRAFTLSLLALGSTRTARVELLNALGQVVSTRVLALSTGGTRSQLDVADLPTGLYVVRVQAGTETATTRLVIE